MGNLQPLFKEEFPKCWGTHEECSTTLLSSTHYTQAQCHTHSESLLAVCCLTAADMTPSCAMLPTRKALIWPHSCSLLLAHLTCIAWGKLHAVFPDGVINSDQVGGIIVGQLALGFAADRIGRKWGSVMTAGVMLVGGILLAAANGPDVRALFIMYTISQAGLLAAVYVAESFSGLSALRSGDAPMPGMRLTSCV